jgi:glutathione S-transferase
VDARDRAIVDMWERRAYEEGLISAAEIFRNRHPLFANRGLPGVGESVFQIPALVERGKQRLQLFFRKFDAQLQRHPFVTGDRFTVADATTLVAVDFAAFNGEKIPEQCAGIRRWHAEVSERPSARAGSV